MGCSNCDEKRSSTCWNCGVSLRDSGGGVRVSAVASNPFRSESRLFCNGCYRGMIGFGKLPEVFGGLLPPSEDELFIQRGKRKAAKK